MSFKVKDLGEKKVFAKFIGPIYQIPPFQACKRELELGVYDLEVMEHNSKSVLFRVNIRNLCDDIGYIRY